MIAPLQGYSYNSLSGIMEALDAGDIFSMSCFSHDRGDQLFEFPMMGYMRSVLKGCIW